MRADLLVSSSDEDKWIGSRVCTEYEAYDTRYF